VWQLSCRVLQLCCRMLHGVVGCCRALQMCCRCVAVVLQSVTDEWNSGVWVVGDALCCRVL